MELKQKDTLQSSLIIRIATKPQIVNLRKHLPEIHVNCL